MKLPARNRVASLDIDAQYTFTPACPDELPVPGGDTIADELNRQAAFADYRLGSKDAHSPRALWVSSDKRPPLSPIEGANMDIRWPRHAVPGTRGFELLDGLPHPADYDFFVWKGVEPDMHPYGACYHDLAGRMSTGLIEFLHSNKINTVLVGGLATDYCVRHTVLQLLDAGFNVVVNRSAIRGVDDASSRHAMAEMLQHGAHFVHDSAQLEQADD
ncbi:nicotinamidase/pyrazinamidase [Oceanisphaera litoralis]|uniref:isochorismatase family protein n=1 Tax=Oceanisphaera litoralis TaxID=225144 RepID=UPI00195D3C1C|nr:isochorismatase family protein [Oceanisphaera litoralis]MBM7456701.1 nicotinamidase/pyrazinamidase [Oceanisphaera litoralis]